MHCMLILSLFIALLMHGGRAFKLPSCHLVRPRHLMRCSAASTLGGALPPARRLPIDDINFGGIAHASAMAQDTTAGAVAAAIESDRRLMATVDWIAQKDGFEPATSCGDERTDAVVQIRPSTDTVKSEEGVHLHPWTAEEDNALWVGVQQLGTNWTKIASTYFPERGASSCKQRWAYSLNPDVKIGPWSAEVSHQPAIAAPILMSLMSLLLFRRMPG